MSRFMPGNTHPALRKQLTGSAAVGLLVACCFVFWSEASLGKPPAHAEAAAKCDPVVEQALTLNPPTGALKVIVQARPGSLRKVEQSVRSFHGDVYRRLEIINALAASVPVARLGSLAAREDVVRISFDGRVSKSDEGR